MEPVKLALISAKILQQIISKIQWHRSAKNVTMPVQHAKEAKHFSARHVPLHLNKI